MRSKILVFFSLIFSLVWFLNCSIPIEQQRNMITPKSFVSEDWRSSDLRWINRPEMARDLIKKEVLIGKTRKEIFEMLGELEFEDDSQSNQITYELEQLFQRSVDLAAVENLKITFNSNDIVENAEIEFLKIDWR